MSVLENNLIETAASRGRKWPVEIAASDLNFIRYMLRDPVPSGRQIIEAAGHHDPTEYIALQWLPDGALEELRLEELTDIEARGVERFIVVRSDRSFRFEVEGLRLEWPCKLISGGTIKTLAGRSDDGLVVVLVREGCAGREVDDGDVIDLSGEGVEIFMLRHRSLETEIFVNEKPVNIRRGVRAGHEIKEAAIKAGVAIQLDFVLSLETGPGQTRIIGDRDRVRVKPGQRFLAISDDDNS
jgi:Multiubiquitin